MDHFVYRNGELHCEQVPMSRIAEAVGTPAYVYSAATFRDGYRAIADAFAELDPIICYSIKSCQNIHILKELVALGAGMDVVSGGELYRAQQAGADPSKIVFAGVGKTDAELIAAIEWGIGWFNIESEPELANLIRLASERNATVRAALRLNPDVDPKTHKHTATGKRESKFGVDAQRTRRIFNEYGHDPHVRLTGIHLHIGSPVPVEPYPEAIRKALQLIADLRADGFTIDTLDIGGGYATNYEDGQAPPFSAYAEAICPLVRDQNLKLIIEPGRSIAANAGVLMTRTTYVKDSGDKKFVIVDAAMNDLIRPSLYDAFHFIWPVTCANEFVPAGRRKDLDPPGCLTVDIVGGICESGDYLARERRFPPVARGDLLSVFSAGAYGMVMAGNYNTRPRAAEVLVDGDQFRVIRRRETYADLLAHESNPQA